MELECGGDSGTDRDAVATRPETTTIGTSTMAVAIADCNRSDWIAVGSVAPVALQQVNDLTGAG